MIRSIETLLEPSALFGCIVCVGEPLTIFACMALVFYAMGWILEKFADFLGIVDDGDLD
tara:strand:+ start:846 stop:1022 length:177 start_codon:yes stop_codon:yes gene_type:complete